MFDQYSVAFLVVLSWLVIVLDASAGDADPHYRGCVKQCDETGCVGQRCFSNCKFSSDVLTDRPWEKERELLGNGPVKYHGKWPFRRIYGMQEPASVAFSAFNLIMHFYGWVSFIMLLYNNLPLKDGKKPYYEYAALWHIYGILSLNSWFWSAVFHSRDVYVTEKLDYSSAVALLGYSLILAILRSFNIKDEATRVMVSSPLIAFVTTHILYINFYKLDYGWNMKVCVVMAVAQLTIWAVWAGVSRHPSRWKLWLVVPAGVLAMLLEIYDFPPYQGLLDAHAIWHATTVPPPTYGGVSSGMMLGSEHPIF